MHHGAKLAMLMYMYTHTLTDPLEGLGIILVVLFCAYNNSTLVGAGTMQFYLICTALAPSRHTTKPHLSAPLDTTKVVMKVAFHSASTVIVTCVTHG